MSLKKRTFHQSMNQRIIILVLALSLASLGFGFQTASTIEPPRTADESFHPEIKNPAYPPAKGPIVMIDEAHNNFHTTEGTYKPFASLLSRDGYVVKRATTKISSELLQSCYILVIADAQLLLNVIHWLSGLL